MTRRHKANWRRTRREKFAFAPLEPRLLLAADVTTVSIPSTDVMGPVHFAPAEISCVVGDEDGATTEEDSQSEFQYTDADCSPTLMRLNDDGSQVDGFSPQSEYQIRIDPLVVNQSTAGTVYYSGRVGASGDWIIWNQSDATYRAVTLTRADTTVLSYNGLGSANDVSEPEQPISITPEDRSLSTIDDIDIEARLNEGNYFQKENASSVVLESESFQRSSEDSVAGVGVIAQRQMFAVASAESSFDNSVSGQTFTATTQFSAGPVTSSSLASSRSPVVTTYSLMDSRIAKTPQMFSSARRVGPHVGSQFDGQLAPKLISVREMISSNASSQQAETSRLTAIKADRMPSTFSSMIYNRIFKPFASVAPETGSAESSNLGRVPEKAEGDIRLARSIQILESAIILIGLPSSRLCREEETAIGKKRV